MPKRVSKRKSAGARSTRRSQASRATAPIAGMLAVLPLAAWRCSCRSGRSTFSASRREMAGSSCGPRSSDRSSVLPFASSLSAVNSSAERPTGVPRSDAPAVELVTTRHFIPSASASVPRAPRASGDVVALCWQLGRGRRLAKGSRPAWVSTRRTFEPDVRDLARAFRAAGSALHLDLYRLEGKDLGTTGWEETLDAGGMTVIEWPDRAGEDLPPDRLDVHLAHIADTKRSVALRATGPRSAELLEGFRDSLGA